MEVRCSDSELQTGRGRPLRKEMNCVSRGAAILIALNLTLNYNHCHLHHFLFFLSLFLKKIVISLSLEVGSVKFDTTREHDRNPTRFLRD